MKINQPASRRQWIKQYSAGIVAVEFALMVPLLLLLVIPIFDLARIVQANMILTNISREGANLAARSSQDPQTIMNAIAATAPPLDMATNGTMYLSKIMGNTPGTPNVILEQYRWTQGYNQSSQVWNNCFSWATDGSGKCSSIPSTGFAINDAMANQLGDGEVIYVVESFYHANLLFSAMNLGFGISTPQFNPDLYAKTIF
jgi:TadE-like protein